MSLFSAHFKAADGKQSQCKACFAARASRRRIGRPCINCGKPKEIGVPKGARLCIACAASCSECKIRPRVKQHRLCSQCQSERDKTRNRRPDRVIAQRVTRIAGKYRVSREVAFHLAAQTRCAACKKEFSRPGEAHVDHCHESGRVRGVLCFNCNAALGHIGDSADRLRALIKYLSTHHHN